MAGNNVEQPRRRGRGRPFVKGQSGNPGGPLKGGRPRPRAGTSAHRGAIETLVSIMRDDGQPGRSRAAAAEALLNRGWGSPTQHVEMDVREQPPLLPYTDEELLARLQALVDEKRDRAKRVH